MYGYDITTYCTKCVLCDNASAVAQEPEFTGGNATCRCRRCSRAELLAVSRVTDGGGGGEGRRAPNMHNTALYRSSVHQHPTMQVQNAAAQLSCLWWLGGPSGQCTTLHLAAAECIQACIEGLTLAAHRHGPDHQRSGELQKGVQRQRVVLWSELCLTVATAVPNAGAAIEPRPLDAASLTVQSDHRLGRWSML